MAYEFGCLMIDFSIKNWKDIISKISKKDIFDNEENEYGIENNPHCTVVFGFVPEVKFDDILSKIKLPKLDTIDFVVKEINLFENKDYDVVKFDCESKVLTKLNKLLMKTFEIKTDFPNYHPHVTIAYVLPGTGKKYCKKFKKQFELHPKKYSFSHPAEKKQYKVI